MRLLWRTRTNPVAWWWALLTLAGGINIAVWFALHSQIRAYPNENGAPHIELMLFLCGAYVFGCAFRSFLPRADVQRICLFDTWLSSVTIGRSVATVAEVCFAAQWSIVLQQLGGMAGMEAASSLALAIVPLIIVAQCCSWYGVLTKNYMANAIENSIWVIAFLLVAIDLCRLLPEFDGFVRVAIIVAIVGIAGYLAFLITIDVPMYLNRWRHVIARGGKFLSPHEGLRDATKHWIVTHDYAEWKDEIAWMSLYFTAAVWASLALCLFYTLGMPPTR